MALFFFSPYTTKRGNPNTWIYGQHLNLITATGDRVRMYENEPVDIPIGLFGHGSICSNNRIATCKTHIEGRIPMALFFLRFSLNYWGMEWGCPSSSVVPFMSTSERKMMRPFFLHFATLFGVFCEKWTWNDFWLIEESGRFMKLHVHELCPDSSRTKPCVVQSITRSNGSRACYC